MLKAHRLQNQQIEFPQYDNPVDVLSHLLAIQGQDFPGAKWSLGLRYPDSTDAQIEAAIAEKKIVRTWLMRGTLFLTTDRDLRWLLDVMGERVIAISQRRYKELELDTETLNRSNDILVNALVDGKQIGRWALYAILEENGISTKGQRGVHIVRHASLESLIVQSTVIKNDPVFMMIDDAIPANNLSRDEALVELARRYFNSRGWATFQDYVWWTGLLMGDVRAGFEAIQSDLIEETVDGVTYYHMDNALKQSPESPCVYVPAGFDEYYLGYSDRNPIIDAEYMTNVCPGNNGIFFPTIVIDGHICGIWKRTIKKKKIQLTAFPFAPLSKEEEAVFLSAIERYGDYMDMPLEITIESPA